MPLGVIMFALFNSQNDLSKETQGNESFISTWRLSVSALISRMRPVGCFRLIAFETVFQSISDIFFFNSQISHYHHCIPVNIFAYHFVPNRLPRKDIIS